MNTNTVCLLVDGQEVAVSHPQLRAVLAQLALHAQAGALPAQIAQLVITFREGRVIDVDFVGRLPRAHY